MPIIIHKDKKGIKSYKTSHDQSTHEALVEAATDGVYRELMKEGKVVASTPPDWEWTENLKYENFLVSFGHKESYAGQGDKFQALAIRKDKRGKWVELKTLVYPTWQQAKQELNRIVKAYNKSMYN